MIYHPALARRLQAYLRWRNTHARQPDVPAEQRLPGTGPDP